MSEDPDGLYVLFSKSGPEVVYFSVSKTVQSLGNTLKKGGGRRPPFLRVFPTSTISCPSLKNKTQKTLWGGAKSAFFEGIPNVDDFLPKS